jgi:hypothetical protein
MGAKLGSITLWEESRLRVFENRVLWKIFRHKEEEVAWSWWRLHNKELHNLYASQNIIRVIKSRRVRWAGHEARIGELWNPYKILIEKPEWKTQLGRTKRRWYDSIRMNRREIWKYGAKMWTGFIWLRIGTSDRLLWTRLMAFVIHKVGNFLTTSDYLASEGLCSMYE